MPNILNISSRNTLNVTELCRTSNYLSRDNALFPRTDRKICTNEPKIICINGYLQI